MPIQFSCPFCGETTLVDDPFAGHTGPCVNCGKLVTVPSVPMGYSLRSAVRQVQRGNWQAAAIIGLFLVGLGIAFYTFYQAIGKPALVAANQAAAKRTCANNLRKIGQAILAYQAANGGVFPPAYTTDASGKPMHNWRVLILPYLGPEGQNLHQQLNMNEAWDSPQNLALASRMPRVFASPLDQNAINLHESNYTVITGPNTMFPDAASRKLAEISDGAANTLMVIEVKTNGKSWMEPKVDLTEFNDYSIGGDLGGNHNNGANALFADGTVHYLYDTTPAEDLQAMTSVNGGENVGPPTPEP
jgi:prepilin-type processing-associated H-X9-DG protein